MHIIANVDEINNLPIEKDTGEILKDINPQSKKENKWNQYKKSNAFVASLLQSLINVNANIVLSQKRVDDIISCADTLIFLKNKENHQKLHQAYFCKFRLCPICNWRRSLKMFAQVSQITDYLLVQKPDVKFLFLTLTIKNCTGAELSDTIDLLLDKVQFIYNKSRIVKGNTTIKNFKKLLIGGLRALEVTYNKEEDTYHPHIHLLLAVQPDYFKKQYVNQDQFSQIWKEILNIDYTPIVDVRGIKNKSPKTIAEVSKYPIKSFELQTLPKDKAMEVLYFMMNASYNRRFVSFFGELKKIRALLQLDDIENGDLIKTSDDDIDGFNPVARVMYRYRADIGMYIS